MYGFGVEEIACTILHVKSVSIGVLDNIENQKMFRPTNCVSRKLLVNFGLALKI